MSIIRCLRVVAALVGAALLLTACQRTPREVSVRGETMGTYYAIKVAGPNLPTAEELIALADSTFERINEQMSTYRDHSELMQWNRADNADWRPLSPELFAVVEQSLDIYQRSSGAFDVTVAPLVDIWGFGPDRRPARLPSAAEIESLRATIGSDKIEIRKEGDQFQGRKPIGLELDLSAIAKGFGADQMSRALVDLGYTRHMVEVGGELAVKGLSARDEPWRIAVETPVYDVLAQAQAPAKVIAVTDIGMATSGDYRNWYEAEGMRVSHTIDPTTGRPITHALASVTVLAPTAAAADGFATAINVLGPEQGLALAEREQLPVFMIVREGDGFITRQSRAFAKFAVETD